MVASKGVTLGLTLEFVLDTLAVWGVADEREDWTDALNEQGALSWVGVIESSL